MCMCYLWECAGRVVPCEVLMCPLFCLEDLLQSWVICQGCDWGVAHPLNVGVSWWVCIVTHPLCWQYCHPFFHPLFGGREQSACNIGIIVVCKGFHHVNVVSFASQIFQVRFELF